MTSEPATQITPTRLQLTHIPDSWRWVWPDTLVRLIPFVIAYAIAYRATNGAPWLGLSPGRIGLQLAFAAVAAPALFAAAVAAQLWLTRRRGVLSVPADSADAWFQAAFYVVNGPIEEAFFRGLMQGGLAVIWGAPAAFAVATTVYVVYHRLGRWTWPDTLATSLVGVPLGLAFWLLPGPASLLGISVAHIAATCGFLGPGPFLLKRMRML